MWPEEVPARSWEDNSRRSTALAREALIVLIRELEVGLIRLPITP
jgi:hypothetical protein